jgi:hypothetical protein
VADHSDSLLKAPQENKIEATLTFSRQWHEEFGVRSDDA